MSEKPTHEFKIRLDDSADEPDTPSKPSSEGVKAAREKRKRTSQRSAPRVLYGVILVLVAAMILGYFDIRSRVLTVHSSGSKETEHLSKDLQSKFSSLAIQISNMESKMGELTDGQAKLSGTVSSLTDELAKANKSISGISSSKADKKSVSSSVTKIEKQLASIEESADKYRADSAVMSAQLKTMLTEMNNISSKASEDQNALKAIVDAIQTDKASKKDLLTEIDHIENLLKANQARIEKQTSSMLQSIQRLDMRTNALEVKTGLPTSSNGSASEETPSGPASGGRSSEPQSPSRLGPGELIERDISQ